MKKAEEKELFRKAIEAFGADEQIGVAQEECAELIIALSKHHRVSKFQAYDKRKVQRCVNNILEEITDVQIMLDQIMIIYGFTAKDVAEIREAKLERLETSLLRNRE